MSEEKIVNAVKSFAVTENMATAKIENARAHIFQSISEFFDTEEGVRDCK